MITEELKKLYIAHTGHEPEQIDEPVSYTHLTLPTIYSV